MVLKKNLPHALLNALSTDSIKDFMVFYHFQYPSNARALETLKYVSENFRMVVIEINTKLVQCHCLLLNY